MKGQVAASAVAIASLAREGFEPAGDLIFAATADEEVGDGFGARVALRDASGRGARRLLAQRGRGRAGRARRPPFYICSVAEKMSAPFRLRVHGRSGHASMPGIADNALVKAAPLIERARRVRAEPRLEPETEALLEAVTGERPRRRRRRSSARGRSTASPPRWSSRCCR